jgi:hypothetical protein
MTAQLEIAAKMAARRINKNNRQQQLLQQQSQ